MKWLEIIELRSIGADRELLYNQLQQLIADVEVEAKEKVVNTYNHVMIDTDYSIHLFHDSAKVEKEGSPLGLLLISALKEFGLVNHSVWNEMK